MRTLLTWVAVLAAGAVSVIIVQRLIHRLYAKIRRGKLTRITEQKPPAGCRLSA